MRETAARYYSERVRQFGATARGVDWNTEQSQALRFEQLLRLIDPSTLTSVNDFGCGYGALVDYLRRSGYRCRYAGFDLSEAMISHAISEHAGDPDCTFTTDPESFAPADYTLASGIFNVKQEHPPEAWREYVLDTLSSIDRLSERGFAFNMLSSYSDADKQRDDLFYGSPVFFFDYCKTHFSPFVAVLHDYPLFEFTLFVRK